MKWYAAHIVTWLKLREATQSTFPIRENIVLVCAMSSDEALEKAEKKAHEDEIIDDSQTWDDKPADWIFAGVRKLIECLPPEKQPSDGTEVTYSEMTVDSEDTLRKLVNGDAIAVIYEM